MKHKPKKSQYRMKRGFFLFPSWHEFTDTGNNHAKYFALDILDNGSIFSFQKLRLQKKIGERWIDVRMEGL